LTRINKNQKTKKWFKPTKPKKKQVLELKYVTPYLNEDFFGIDFVDYGYNHKNRDRSGGHKTKRYIHGYKHVNHNKRDRLKNMEKIHQGIFDYYEDSV
jgi:hypothetical protein